MNRTIKAILAIIFIGVIMFCSIMILQNLGKHARVDVTDQKLYTLSDGTKNILGKMNQPIKLKLYYTKTAAMKAPDQIRFFNNYFYYVESLLQEYARASKGMIELSVIDPRPFTEDEASAKRYDLKGIPINEEENFYFGLALQTQFGVTQAIKFFAPERQNFIEYDISSLIDSAIKRQKKTIGVMSSLGVTGADMSDYMVQMMVMQGQRPPGPWAIIRQLKKDYEVKKIDTDVNEINGVDLLMVIHPKDFSDKTLFAIDQYVLKGGRTMVFVDPMSFIDQASSQQQQQMAQQRKQSFSSNMPRLMDCWGLQMKENTFAGDRAMALTASISQGERPSKIIGFLGITKDGLNRGNVITGNLNDKVMVLFAGALKKLESTDANSPKLSYVPLISTSKQGNTFTPSNEYELMMPSRLMSKFTDGSEPVCMGYLVTGKFKSGYPLGITIEDPNSDPNHPKVKKIEGLTEAKEDCVVAVFSDVDFISDKFTYQDSFFGSVAFGDNASLFLNTVDYFGGSTDLIGIRSRGAFSRPFTVVEEIEKVAEKGTAEEETKINAEIEAFKQELQKILTGAKDGDQEVIGSSIMNKKRDLELKIYETQKRLQDLKKNKREKTEQLGETLRNRNTLPGPIVILVIAIVLWQWRKIKKKHYISHASDA